MSAQSLADIFNALSFDEQIELFYPSPEILGQ